MEVHGIHQQNVTASGYTLIDADTTENTGKFGTQVTPPVKTYTGFTSPSPKTLTITSNELANLVEYQYARNKYNLTVNPNGGSGTMANDTHVMESQYTLKSSIFTTPANKHFKTWNTKSDGTGTSYAAGASVKNISTGSDITLYAIWENCNYSKKTLSSTYLKSAASCTAAATYYYNCSTCSKKGSTTFTNDSALGHDYKIYKYTNVACTTNYASGNGHNSGCYHYSTLNTTTRTIQLWNSALTSYSNVTYTAELYCQWFDNNCEYGYGPVSQAHRYVTLYHKCSRCSGTTTTQG